MVQKTNTAALDSKVRHPAVAGYFYPDDPDELTKEIKRCFSDKVAGTGVSNFEIPKSSESSKVECFVVPHAGYSYSGPVAAHSYHAANQILWCKKTTVIVVGPNHYGIGNSVALSPHDYWLTPLGSVKIDKQGTDRLLAASGMFTLDTIAHSREHSIEVQLPFAQYLGKSFSFVPICLALQDLNTAKKIARALSEIIQNSENEHFFLVLGSSDLTHYESQQSANSKDEKLIEKICNLDLQGFYTVLERNNISACGYGCIATLMELARLLDKKKGNLLKYATSGDVTGDKRSVVGYSAVHFV
ncbi:MAG: AmmeMemoRadiSam system protein B [Nitrososphaerales archaeon]